MESPSETFIRLPEEKKQRIITAFLHEFTDKKYDDASLSVVVKKLGIAKGSIYQYFSDKIGVFFYLIELCKREKISYHQKIKRSDYADFWDYWRALFEVGFDFDRDHPEMSNFMLTVFNSMDSPTLKSHFQLQRRATLIGLEKMLEPEVTRNHFRADISVKSLAHYLMIVNEGLLDYLQLEHQEHFEKCISNGTPLYTSEIGTLCRQRIDESIKLLKAAFKTADGSN